MKDCPFCPMFKDTTESVIDIEPLNPVTPGHRLIIPREHVMDFSENADVSARVMRRASEYAKSISGDCNLITSKGGSATQTVMHLHVHIVPRCISDGLQLPWTSRKEKGLV